MIDQLKTRVPPYFASTPAAARTPPSGSPGRAAGSALQPGSTQRGCEGALAGQSLLHRGKPGGGTYSLCKSDAVIQGELHSFYASEHDEGISQIGIQ
jgi:hypothetical protein